MNSVKRLAGPAFYVNCEFDDFSLTQRKVNTDPKSFLTKAYGNTSDSTLFDVKEGEILVTHAPNQRGKRMFQKCGRARVFSSLNGVEAVDPVDLVKKHRFIGVAQTGHKYTKNPRNNQGLVACVGGVITINNLSDDVISPGQPLYMKALGTKYKKNRRRGIHAQKMVFCLSPTSDAKDGVPVAKALSYSKPGQRLDILLHPRQPYRPPQE